jgi:hypothetical protein
MKLKDWADRLIWATVLISIVRYAAAFAASDVGQITGIWSSILTLFLSLTGLGMGILDTVGGGLLFNGWSKVLPKRGASGSARFNILSVCVFTLLISGLFILVPFTMSRLSHESVLSALGGKNSFWAWMWSLMVNLIPYVLIAGVFVGNRMVSSLESEEGSGNSVETSKNVPDQGGKIVESSKKVPDWRKVKSTLTSAQMQKMAEWTPDQMRTYASQTGFTYKTVSNYRLRARQELGLQVDSESNQIG